MRISDWSSDVCSSDAIGADLGDAEMSRAIAAAVGGDTAAIGPELTRLRDAGVSPIPPLRGLVRRLMTIAALRAENAAGGAIDAAIGRATGREKVCPYV